MVRSFSEQVYTELLLGNKVRLSIPTKQEFNSLRVALYRYHVTARQAQVTDLSIISSYSEESEEALFRLGVPTRATAPSYTFTILEGGDEKVP